MIINTDVNRRSFLKTAAGAATSLALIGAGGRALADDGTIKIASLLDLSGGLDAAGKPMQDAMMEQMQAKMLANMDKFSPETFMQSWFSFDPKMGERFQDLFVNMAGLASRPREKK